MTTVNAPLERMCVLHVLPFPGVGGTEVATRRIIEAVKPYGVESQALLLDPTEPLIRYFENARIPTLTVPSVPQPSFRRAVPFLRDSWALSRELRRTGARLIHCADILGAYHVAPAARMAGVPVLCHVRNRYSSLSWRERFPIATAHHFAFVSQHTRTHFALRLPDRRTSVVYDGLEALPDSELRCAPAVAREVRAEFGLPPDAQIAAMFARVAPQKDYETLIRAAGTLARTHSRLVFLIVGDNSGRPEHREHYDRVRRLIAETSLEKQFLFAGFRSDTRRLMLAANVCVLSTNWEGLPLVLLEAMAAALPIVATAVDGVPEVVTDGVTGWLAPHGDAAALVQHLDTLLANPDLARRMGEAGRDDVRHRFTPERFARDIHELYKRLAHTT